MSIFGGSPGALREEEKVLHNRTVFANVLPISLKYSLVVRGCCSYFDVRNVEKYLENH